MDGWGGWMSGLVSEWSWIGGWLSRWMDGWMVGSQGRKEGGREAERGGGTWEANKKRVK